MTVPVLSITGPVGVGKTTIALEVSNRLEQAGRSHDGQSMTGEEDAVKRYREP
jgi:nucleoside-triphosphatase THEP1